MTYRRAGCGKATCPVLRGAWVATDALGSPMVELGTHSATERAELDTLHLPESVHREHPAYSNWGRESGSRKFVSSADTLDFAADSEDFPALSRGSAL